MILMHKAKFLQQLFAVLIVLSGITTHLDLIIPFTFNLSIKIHNTTDMIK